MVTGSTVRILSIAATCSLVFAATYRYREALPGYQFSFPRDHFEHEDFRTEWWYYTGNVTGTNGARFGFELVFFRNGERHETGNESAWNPQQLYLAHAALTDVNGKHFWYEEKLNRKGPDIAGASFARQRIWNGNWSAIWQRENQTLEATTENFRFHLQLSPEKPLVLQGDDGLSQKAEGAGRASYYVSYPRLRVSGEIDSAGMRNSVTGTAWMDHEWFTHQLAADQQGWDWFSVQLDNHTELMLFELRKKDGSLDPYSSGTFISADGVPHHLKRNDFQLTPLAKTDLYPTEWRVSVPSWKIDLKCKAALADQELKSQRGPSYWEGAVDYSGSHRGVGYLEMTGYSGAIRM